MRPPRPTCARNQGKGGPIASGRRAAAALAQLCFRATVGDSEAANVAIAPACSLAGRRSGKAVWEGGLGRRSVISAHLYKRAIRTTSRPMLRALSLCCLTLAILPATACAGGAGGASAPSQGTPTSAPAAQRGSAGGSSPSTHATRSPSRAQGACPRPTARPTPTVSPCAASCCSRAPPCARAWSSRSPAAGTRASPATRPRRASPSRASG